MNHFAPGIHIENRPDDDVQNCRNAMQVADDCLGVPSIITAEEMSNPNIPELAVMAYTVQFRNVSGLIFTIFEFMIFLFTYFLAL